jgi:hypothetical protein
MKLWLQVLFAQGYLWRDRFPESFEYAKPDRWRPNALNLLWAASLVTLGAMWIYYGSAIFGPLLPVTGIAYLVGAADFLGLDRVVVSRAFWTSVSWACGALTVGGFAVLLILSFAWQLTTVVNGDSVSLGLAVVFVGSAGFMVFFGSMSLHAIECRYLFFADPRINATMLDDPEWNPRELWSDTYLHLPAKILKTVFRRPREVE